LKIILYFIIVINFLCFCNLAGHYLASMQKSSTLSMTKEEMYNLMYKELKEGCVECAEVKAGFIGEVGSTWPIEGPRIIEPPRKK